MLFYVVCFSYNQCVSVWIYFLMDHLTVLFCHRFSMFLCFYLNSGKKTCSDLYSRGGKKTSVKYKILQDATERGGLG